MARLAEPRIACAVKVRASRTREAKDASCMLFSYLLLTANARAFFPCVVCTHFPHFVICTFAFTSSLLLTLLLHPLASLPRSVVHR